MAMSADQICGDLKKLANALISKFRNAESQLEADSVTRLYDCVRLEDSTKHPDGNRDSVNASKTSFNATVKDLLASLFDSFVDPSLERVAASTNMDFLNVLLANWWYIKIFALTFKVILSKHGNFYLYSAQLKKDCPTIARLTLGFVRQRILDRYKSKITKIITETLENERNHENTEKEKVKLLIEIIGNCGLQELADIVSGSFRSKAIQFKKYEIERNNKPILATTTPLKFFSENYFQAIKLDCAQSYRKKLATMPAQPAEYVAETVRLLKDEKQRASYYFFDSSLEQSYITQVEKELIDGKLEEVLKQQGGIDSFIASSGGKELIQTYALCLGRQEKTFPFLKDALTAYFLNEGKKIGDTYLENKDFVAYIQGIVVLKTRGNEIVKKFFNNNVEFSKLAVKIFKDVLRYQGGKDNPNKIELMSAKNLVNYADKKVKECSRIDAEDQREQILNKIIIVLESLMARDRFLEDHRRAMSKRLLEPYSEKPNSEVERLLISKLMSVVCPEQVQKHLTMIRDYDSSTALEQRVREQLEGNVLRIVPIVRANNSWPNDDDIDGDFPNTLIHEKVKVETVFQNTNPGKYLHWKINRGTSTLEITLLEVNYRVTMNNFMLFILLHILEGKNNTILFGDLKQKFKLKKVKTSEGQGLVYDSDLKLNLLTLVEHKLVLRERKLETTINEGEVLRVNLNYVYTPPKAQAQKKGPNVRAARVVPITLKPGEKLRNSLKMAEVNTIAIIKKERQIITDFSVVKLLKSYKNVTYSTLFQDLNRIPSMQKFDFVMNDVKEAVQRLINKDYCVRDETAMNSLTYTP